MSEYVDRFMLHVPTTVLGSSFTPKTIKAVQSEVDNLRTQLANANERVAELESQLQLTALTTHEASFESEYGKKRLNKFAIEQKIEALDSLCLNPNNESEDRIVAIIDERIEQLRKEQGSE